MNWINSWGAGAKQWDKLGANLRLFGLIVLDCHVDLSAKHIRLIVFNVGFDYKR